MWARALRFRRNPYYEFEPFSLRHFIPVERSPFAVPRLKTQQPRGSATDLWTAAPVRWLVSALSRPFFPEPLECGQSTAVRHPPDFSYKSPCGFLGLFEPQLISVSIMKTIEDSSSR